MTKQQRHASRPSPGNTLAPLSPRAAPCQGQFPVQRSAAQWFNLQGTKDNQGARHASRQRIG
jgi:hypothetical protein